MVGGLSFAFGGDTGETPESIKRKRAIAQALLASQRAPRNVGEGLNALGDGIVANVLGRRADAAEEEGIASANEAFSPILASLGFGEFPAAPSAPMSGAPVGEVERAPIDPASARVAQAHGDLSGDKQTFISTLMPAALEASKLTGVDPRIILAQGALESGWGKSAPGNNFFGIKSHGKGGGQTLATNEVIDGKTVRINDSFRTFDSPADSVMGYAGFLLENPRYKPMMEAQGLDAQIEALGASGYATDPNYAAKIRQIAMGIPLPEAQPTQVASLDPSVGMPASRPAQPTNPQIAQALTQQPSTRPEMAGRSNTPSLGMLLGASGHEFLNPSQRGIIEALIQQRMKEMDPMTALQRRKMELELRNLENPQPDPTDDMREYEFAKSQGFEGSFTEFMTAMRQAGATNVTVGQGEVGTIPQGFELFTDPATGARSMRPIPGGPAAAEAEAAALAEQNRRQGEVERGGLVAEEIDRALNVMDTGILPDTGFGAFLSGVPGTDAKSLASRLETIKANIGFEELNKMRQQSPTGGALGQVTERELAFLQSVAGSLDQAQSDEDLRYNLNRLWNAYMETIHGKGNFEPRPLDGPAPKADRSLQDMTDEELEAIINGDR